MAQKFIDMKFIGMKSMGWLPALAFALALPALAQAVQPAPAAGANDAAKEIATAAAHAGMALGAADLKMAQTHLHHVVNCIVGPSGKGFDAQAGNPCKGAGDGALVDAKGDAATEAKLHSALADAEQGLRATTVDTAHVHAKSAMTTLQAK